MSFWEKVCISLNLLSLCCSAFFGYPETVVISHIQIKISDLTAGSFTVCMLRWCMPPLIEVESGPPIRQGQQWVSQQLSRVGVRRQGLMKRLIGSLPCHGPTCHRVPRKKPHSCPFKNIPRPPSSNFMMLRPPVNTVTVSFLLDSTIWLGILSCYLVHV